MANSPDQSDSPVPSDTAVLNSSSTDPPKDDEEDPEDFKIRRTPSMISDGQPSMTSDRESLVNSDTKGSMSSPEHGGSRYIRRQESTQSSRSRVLSRRSVKSHSFSQSPESDNLRRSFRRLRSGSLNYMHHDSIVSSFLEQLQKEPPVDPHKGIVCHCMRKTC